LGFDVNRVACGSFGHTAQWLVAVLPLSGSDSDVSFEIEGRSAPKTPAEQPVADLQRDARHQSEQQGPGDGAQGERGLMQITENAAIDWARARRLRRETSAVEGTDEFDTGNIGTFSEEWARSSRPIIGFRSQRPFSLESLRVNSVYDW